MNWKGIFISVSILILLFACIFSCYDRIKFSNLHQQPEFSYEIQNEEIRLIKITGFSKGSPVPSKLTIPGTLTINGKEYTVTSVGGFSDTSIKKVVINFQPFIFRGTVEDEAFRNCRNLRSVTASSGTILNFGDSCFEGCRKLVTFTAKVNYPDKGGLLSLPFGENCFKDCVKLKKVIIPDNSRSIEKSAFENCKSLSQIDLKNIKYIKERAFYGCYKLKEVHIPDSVSSIGDKAFLRIPELIISIMNHHGIQTTAFPDTVTLIERNTV